MPFFLLDVPPQPTAPQFVPAPPSTGTQAPQSQNTSPVPSSTQLPDTLPSSPIMSKGGTQQSQVQQQQQRRVQSTTAERVGATPPASSTTGKDTNLPAKRRTTQSTQIPKKQRRGNNTVTILSRNSSMCPFLLNHQNRPQLNELTFVAEFLMSNTVSPF